MAAGDPYRLDESGTMLLSTSLYFDLRSSVDRDRVLFLSRTRNETQNSDMLESVGGRMSNYDLLHGRLIGQEHNLDGLFLGAMLALLRETGEEIRASGPVYVVIGPPCIITPFQSEGGNYLLNAYIGALVSSGHTLGQNSSVMDLYERDYGLHIIGDEKLHTLSGLMRLDIEDLGYQQPARIVIGEREKHSDTLLLNPGEIYDSCDLLTPGVDAFLRSLCRDDLTPRKIGGELSRLRYELDRHLGETSGLLIFKRDQYTLDGLLEMCGD